MGKNVLDQLGKIVTTGNSGCYIPHVKKIALENAYMDDTLTHELKHAKHFDILKSHPELNDQWAQISRNEDGKSLYAPVVAGVANRFRLLNLLVPKDLTRPTRDELLKQGFVSEYARTNIYEDIAELCSVAEEVSFSSSCSTYSSLENALLSDDPAYDKIQRKVALAEKYGLISPGLKEFGQVRKEINPCYAAKEDHHKIAHRASNFVAKYPSSIHASHVAQLAADAHLSLATIYNGDPNDYFRACAQVINLPYVEPDIIDIDLKMLADLYSIAGDRDSMRAVNGTRVDYKTRRAEGNVLIGISEVRERLKARGVDLDNLPTLKPDSITIFNTHRWSENSGW